MHTVIGQKKEQTQKFRVDGKRIPVTVVDVQNNPVIAIRTMDRDGYWAVQLGYGTTKKPSKPIQGHIKGANVEKAPQFFKEVRFFDVTSADEMPKVGEFVSLESVLEPGDVIDVTGTSKGKGFAGGVKRYHFKGGPRTHGQSDRERAPGSLGQTTTPGRVYKGKRMAGKMGFETVTVKNLTVAGIDGNTLYIEGLIPGMSGAVVTIEKKNKKDKRFAELIEMAEKAAEAAKKAEEEAASQAAKEAAEAPKAEEPMVASADTSSDAKAMDDKEAMVEQETVEEAASEKPAEEVIPAESVETETQAEEAAEVQDSAEKTESVQQVQDEEEAK